MGALVVMLIVVLATVDVSSTTPAPAPTRVSVSTTSTTTTIVSALCVDESGNRYRTGLDSAIAVNCWEPPR
jgi:hypothetical protein